MAEEPAFPYLGCLRARADSLCRQDHFRILYSLADGLLFVDRVIKALTGGMDDELLKELKCLIDSGEKAAKRRGHRGAASFRYAPSRFQGEQEEDVCKDLKHSLSSQAQGDLRNIRKNDKCNFPDCLAELDGKLVGIEVWELMDPCKDHTYWTFERFQQKLCEGIREKDKKADIEDRPEFLATLSQLILLIHTDEETLMPETLR